MDVYFANYASAFQDSALPPLVAALQIQVSRDFYGAWGINASLHAVALGKNPPAGAWVIGLFQNADVAGALGYHDVTPDGLPLGKVFVETTLAAGDSVSVTASHETLEMLADPGINLVAEVDDANGSPLKFYAYEAGDPCEADELGYPIEGMLVSDFVHPEWFESFRAPGSVKFDHMGKITAPFQLLPGGYISVLDLSSGLGWQQITADRESKTLAKARANVGSRRERRRTSRALWTPSEYAFGPSL
jgi:hypothetical protein